MGRTTSGSAPSLVRRGVEFSGGQHSHILGRKPCKSTPCLGMSPMETGMRLMSVPCATISAYLEHLHYCWYYVSAVLNLAVYGPMKVPQSLQ